jgi:type III secretion protein R
MNSMLINLTLGNTETSLAAQSNGFASNQMHMLGIMVFMSVLPFAMMMLTSFSKIVVVLSMVRSALGTQQAPPTMVLTGLAAILSATVMTPTFEKMYKLKPGNFDGNASELISSGTVMAAPLIEFLVKHGNAEERAHFVDMARELRPVEEATQVSESDLSVVVPAFVITELKEAFIIGFLLFLPFLVLDMLVANVLLALGMQSLSPSQVSLPFKILLFVAVDGWALLAKGLVLGYR